MRPTPQPTHRAKARHRAANKRKTARKARAKRQHLMEAREGE